MRFLKKAVYGRGAYRILRAFIFSHGKIVFITEFYMKRFEKVFVAFCLIATSVITVATSKVDDEIDITLYGAASNCSNASITNQVIGVTDNMIVSPDATDFTDLGLPQPTLSIATETTTSGTVNAKTRVCTYSVNTTSGTLHVYSCLDDGNPECMVTFAPQ